MVQEWLEVWTEDGTVFIDVGEASRLDAAVSEFLLTGRDELLHLEGWVGEPITFCVSYIRGWIRTDEALRRRNIEQQHEAEEQAKAIRVALGIFD